MHACIPSRRDRTQKTNFVSPLVFVNRITWGFDAGQACSHPRHLALDDRRGEGLFELLDEVCLSRLSCNPVNENNDQHTVHGISGNAPPDMVPTCIEAPDQASVLRLQRMRLVTNDDGG